MDIFATKPFTMPGNMFVIASSPFSSGLVNEPASWLEGIISLPMQNQ